MNSRDSFFLAGFRFPFFCVGANQNVRGNGLVVNSVFLVQLRKIFATDFHGLARIKKIHRMWL